MNKMIKKINTCHCERSAANQSNYIAKFFDWTVSFLAVTGILLILTACDNKETPAPDSKPTIKIGVALPLSGDGAFAGQSSLKAINLELDKLKEKGLKYNYDLIVEDIQFNSARAASVANKFANMDKVNAINSIWSIAGNVMSSIADAKGVLHFGCSYGEQATKGALNFNTIHHPTEMAEFFAKELKKRGINKVAFVIEMVGGNMENKKAIDEVFAKNGIELVLSETVVFGEKDFRILIAKIQEKNPQMVINVGVLPNPFLFLKQWREAGGDINQVTTFDGFLEMSPDQRPIAEGLWFVDGNNVGDQKFVEEYFAKYGEENMSCSGSAAANMQVIVDAFENAKLEDGKLIPTNKAVSDWIWANVKDYPSPVGNITVINEGLMKITPSLKVLKNGKPVLVEKK